MRYVLPVLAGRVARVVTRLRGGGSAFPGYVVNRLAPGYLAEIAVQVPHGIVFVLGSNGKSTTTHFVSEILRAHGLRVFTNPTGANLPQGVTSAMLPDVDWRGRLRADVAVLEIDEAFAVDLATRLTPTVVLMLNVQVDQLYRFYETDRVADMMLNTGVLAERAVVSNADDEFLRTIASRVRDDGPEVTFFGVSGELVSGSPNGLANAQNFRDPAADVPVAAEVVERIGSDVAVRLGSERVEFTMPVRGLHYAADAAAALETARQLLGAEFDSASAVGAFAGMKPAYGRGELLDLGVEQAEVTMFKNGPSLQLNLDAFDHPPEQMLLAIDEGTPDISWIYDVDFSALSHVDIVSGEKAWQIAACLGYRGVPVGRVEPDLATAIRLMRAMPAPSRGRKQWVVNYELMMAARKLVGQGDMEIAR